MQNILDDIRRQLRGHADKTAQKNGQRFFKEPVTMYGMKTEVAPLFGQETAVP